MTIQHLNKDNPRKFIMTDGAIFIPAQSLFGIKLTDKKEEAEKWSFADTLSIKLAYFRKVTGLDLKWVSDK